ncbi:MAG: VWA domain-containing protein [Lachnospiraceae bacterium]|nr:VWA domain-containing protein [Lachnospiraceae bacterium]
MDLEEALDFLYSREQGEDVRREGGTGKSRLTAATWITRIRKLFPKETVEILERQALDHYGMKELLTDKEVLEKLELNQELLKTILQLKHLMKGDVLDAARRIVKKVADEIAEKLNHDIRRSLLGKIDKNSSSPIPSMRNLDIQKTIRKNLKNFDMENQRLMLEQVYFNSRTRKYSTWRVIIAVDESGSMLDSVIHSAVMAGIFAKLPMLDTKLVIFDTQVVDLSAHLEDPVATLMSIQLGGGTHIAGALQYCETLIENPHKTMVVLVSDLCEGGGVQGLLSVSRGIIESGAKLICLTALDMEANPVYDRYTAQKMADLGAHVGAMTPEALGDFMGKIMNG